MKRWGERVARLERAQGTKEDLPAGLVPMTEQEKAALFVSLRATIANLKAGNQSLYHEATIARLEKEKAAADEHIAYQHRTFLNMQATIDEQDEKIAGLRRANRSFDPHIAELEATILRLQGEKEQEAKRSADLLEYAKVVEGERNEAAQKASQATTLIRRCTSCRHRYDWPCGYVTVEGWRVCPNWHEADVKPEPERACANCAHHYHTSENRPKDTKCSKGIFPIGRCCGEYRLLAQQVPYTQHFRPAPPETT